MTTHLQLGYPSVYSIETPFSVAMDAGSSTLDLRAKVSLVTLFNPSFNQTLLALWPFSGGTNVATFYIDTSGILNVAYIDNTAAAHFPAANVFLASALVPQQIKWLRALITPSAGTCDFYTSDDGSSWTSHGTQITGLGTNPIRAGGVTPPNLSAANEGGGFVDREFPGRLYRTQLLVGGSMVSDMDWSGRTVGSNNTTYVASTGETWTTTGAAVVQDDAVVRARRSSTRRA